MLLAALLFRAPALLFAELNWDEALYRLIATDLLHGTLPYVTLWDRKPAGLFALIAAIEGALGGTMITLRLVTALVVGAGGFCLATITRRLVPTLPAAGPVAGLLWCLYSAQRGGEGVNAELFFVPLNLAAFALLLRAPSRSAWLVAGVLMGLAFEVKFNALFSWFGFAAILIRMRPHDGIGARANWLAALIGGAAPTLMIAATYVASGQFGVWYEANIAAQLASGSFAEPIDLAALGFGLAALTPLLGLAAIAAVGWPRVLGRLLPWLAAEALALLFLHRFADHMFLQLLPPLCVAAGVASAGLAAWSPRRVPGAALLLAGLAVLGWEGRALARPYAAALEIAQRRQTTGDAAWGDPVATAAARLRASLHPGETLYVLGGPVLSLYASTGRAPPTRFAFTEHLWKPYAPVDGMAELRRILATRPAMIALPATWTAPEPFFALLHQVLRADYAPAGTIPPFVSAGGGAVGPQLTIVLYRREGT